MLIMPIERVAVLLQRAATVESEALDSDTGDLSEGLEDELDQMTLESGGYRALRDTLEAFTPDELQELLALAALGEDDEAEISWDEALEKAQAIAAEDALDELARILILTDAIETGLDRLGYDLDEEDAADELLELEEEEAEGEEAEEEEEVEEDKAGEEEDSTARDEAEDEEREPEPAAGKKA